MTNREAFQQGYVRGMYKTMDAIHKAFRQGWDAKKIEAMLRRMNSQKELEAETDDFERAAEER